MAFFDRTDIEQYMEAQEIDQIIDGDNTIIDTVIADAEEFGAEKLRQRFDIVFEYAQTGNARNKSLLKQIVAIAVFYLSERLPTNVLPEARENAYHRAEDWLNDVANGLRMTSLRPLDDENQVGYTIRWGSGTANGGNHY